LSKIVRTIDKFVPVIRETIEYLLRLDILPSEKKSEIGKRLIEIYKDKASSAAHLEYSRMYMLRPFALDGEWNSDEQYIKLYQDALDDDFSKREVLLAMGRSKKAFWFRSRKQNLHQMTPWIRRAFIYAASCLPSDEYKHWIRGIDSSLDNIERAVATWARKNPITVK